MSKRVADMTPEQLERKRSRDRAENMTPEQLERKRSRCRIAGRKENMTPEQLERARARYRAKNQVANMSPDQVKRLRTTQCRWAAEANAKKAPDMEVFMLNKIYMATGRPHCEYRIPSTCPPELAAKLAPVLEMLKTADAAQREVIRGVVRAMRAARELELAESVAQ